MSDTPKTDEALIDNADFSDEGYGKSNYVSADFARKLERELLQSQAQVAEMMAALGPFKRMADKFDFEEYKERWPDSTCIQENETLLAHCFLTLGDFRKAKQASSTTNKGFIRFEELELLVRSLCHIKDLNQNGDKLNIAPNLIEKEINYFTNLINESKK